MKSLHILKTSDGATWAWRQMRELKLLGVDVQVVLPCIGKMNDEYRKIGIPVHILDCDIAKMRSLCKFFRTKQLLSKIIDDIKPDILHSHFVGTTLFMRLAVGRNHGPRRVFQVPGPLHLESRWIRSAEIWLAGPRDYWIASCQMTKQIYLSEGITPARVGFSFYGTDVDALEAGQAGLLRSSLGLADAAKLVGMVAYAYKPKRWLGQRRGIKGHEDLIDAVCLLRQQGRDLVLIFAGGGWLGADAYFESIKSYAKKTLGSRAVFLGNRNDVADIYADLDVAVHPSHSENLGGAVESLMSSVPTVATNVGGFPDIVIPNKTGWLCDPASPVSLASAIAEVLDNPVEAEVYAKTGHDLVKRELDVKRTAKQVHDYYKSILTTDGGA